MPLHKQDNTHKIAAARAAKNQENAGDSSHAVRKIFSSETMKADGVVTERKALNAKSSNTRSSYGGKDLNIVQKTHSSSVSGNTNKARKVIKKPFSIFPEAASTSNNSISAHDTTTLQRSYSQKEQSAGSNSSFNTLSRSSTFGSSSNYFADSGTYSKNSLKPTRRIKSQLTIGAENDIVAFFKNSKLQEQKQLGITDTKNTENKPELPLDEVTFTEDADDITSMKKILMERDSPVYQRTHKVNLHTLLSSSVDEDDVQETTFEYKDKGGGKVQDLEALILSRPNSTGDQRTDDLELEIVGHDKTNDRYNDSIPDCVLDGLYQPMSKDVLTNLWNDPTPASISAAAKFKDPLNLPKSWRETANEDILKINNEQTQEPVELELEFSDIDNDDDGSDIDLNEIADFYARKV